MSIDLNNGTIALVGPINPIEFIANFKELIKAGHESIKIEANDPGSLYPNINVPIAATINYYKERGIQVILDEQSKHPMVPSIIAPVETPTLSRVCKFTHDSAFVLADELIESLKGQVEFARGSIDAFYWCIYEIMDNVGNHSETLTGFMEVQLHKTNKRLAICIADAGRGIRGSLSERRRSLASDEDAITVAMERRMTRQPGLYQGNGLWGLTRFVEAGQGMLSISSGTGQVTIGMDPVSGYRSKKSSGRVWLGDDSPGTVVDFQIPYNQPIDFEKVTGQKAEVEFADKILDDNKRYTLRIASQARGYATRRSGAEMYNKTINYLNAIPFHIILDFDGIQIISSSFADEFIGKLVKNMTFAHFTEKVRIINTEPNVKLLINEAVEQRLMERRKATSVS